MQRNTDWGKVSVWISVVTVLLVLGLLYNVITIEMPETPTIPPVPTAEEIAAAIVVPEVVVPEVVTHLSVRAEKIEVAKDLIVDEMNDRDFKEDVSELLTDECDDIDIERRDINDIKIKEVNYEWFNENMPVWDEDGTIVYELKIYFDNDGDEDEAGKALIEANFYITDLDYDDDYEDAEVDSYDLDFIKAYGDIEC